MADQPSCTQLYFYPQCPNDECDHDFPPKVIRVPLKLTELDLDAIRIQLENYTNYDRYVVPICNHLGFDGCDFTVMLHRGHDRELWIDIELETIEIEESSGLLTRIFTECLHNP